MSYSLTLDPNFTIVDLLLCEDIKVNQSQIEDEVKPWALDAARKVVNYITLPDSAEPDDSTGSPTEYIAKIISHACPSTSTVDEEDSVKQENGTVTPKVVIPKDNSGSANQAGISLYWRNRRKTLADRRPGKTFVRSDGVLACAQCCFGDRCDERGCFNRESCPYCMGTGINATTEPTPRDWTIGDVIAAYPDGTIVLDDGITTWNDIRAKEFLNKRRHVSDEEILLIALQGCECKVDLVWCTACTNAFVRKVRDGHLPERSGPQPNRYTEACEVIRGLAAQTLKDGTFCFCDYNEEVQEKYYAKRGQDGGERHSGECLAARDLLEEGELTSEQR